MRRPGLWVANGRPDDVSKMYSWNPGAITCFYEHLSDNQVAQYKVSNPDVPVLVRFKHPRNWQQDVEGSAQQLGQYVAGKWSELAQLNPYVCFGSRMNMHYENDDPNPANQHFYTTPEFYEKYAGWVRIAADVIKNSFPNIKLITPPFAFGYNEDGSPSMSGNPIKGWAGYDFLQQTVQDYFDDILAFHGFWGYPGGGSMANWLYEPELATWYAFRWQRVLRLFEVRYGIKAKVFIDAAGNFSPSDSDFTEQLIYYARNCLNDSRVIGLTYFLWSDSTQDPLYGPNVWVNEVTNLAQQLDRLKNMPDINIGDASVADPGVTGLLQTVNDGAAVDTADAKTHTIRVLFEDGTVKVLPAPPPPEKAKTAPSPREAPAAPSPGRENGATAVPHRFPR